MCSSTSSSKAAANCWTAEPNHLIETSLLLLCGLGGALVFDSLQKWPRRILAGAIVLAAGFTAYAQANEPLADPLAVYLGLPLEALSEEAGAAAVEQRIVANRASYHADEISDALGAV